MAARSRKDPVLTWFILIAGVWARPQWSTLIVFAAVFAGVAFAVINGLLPIPNSAIFGAASGPGIALNLLIMFCVAACIVIGRKWGAWNTDREVQALMRYQQREIARRQAEAESKASQG